MMKDENKCDNNQPYNIPKNVTENVVTPEVKILNRGDLLGAINCLFPELQLKSSHIKLKENFSLFSYSLQELTRIFESGRKYRNRIVKNIKCSITNNSLSNNSSRINFKTSTKFIVKPPTKNKAHSSGIWKSKAQTKNHKYQTEPSKRYETVKFQSSYTDFVTKYLDAHFTDRFVDVKNIECVIQELHILFKEICKEDKIGPFNPNLPVLNISECNHAERMNNGSKDGLKTNESSSIKHIIHKKKSRSHLAIKHLKTQRTQNEVRGKEKRAKVRKRRKRSQQDQINGGLTADSDDESGRIIERNIDDLLSDDNFSPRYQEKHLSDMRTVFRKSLNRNGSTSTLEKEAIEQYENVDDAGDVNINFLEVQARQQYESEIRRASPNVDEKLPNKAATAY